MGSPVLVVGLGGVGEQVLLALEELRSASQGVPFVSLAIDVVSSDRIFDPLTDWRRKAELESCRIDAERVREALQRLRSGWKLLDEDGDLFSWWPGQQEIRLRNDIEPSGSAGVRPLGRLGFLLERRRGDSAISAAMERLKRKARNTFWNGEPRVAIVAGAGGGTGSAILFDVINVIYRREPGARILICLVVPDEASGRASEEKPRDLANTYALIRELAYLKSEGASPEWILREDGYRAFAEALTRIFLFESSSFESGIERVAKAVFAQLNETLWRDVSETAGRLSPLLVEDSSNGQDIPWFAATGASWLTAHHINETDVEILDEIHGLLHEVVTRSETKLLIDIREAGQSHPVASSSGREDRVSWWIARWRTVVRDHLLDEGVSLRKNVKERAKEIDSLVASAVSQADVDKLFDEMELLLRPLRTDAKDAAEAEVRALPGGADALEKLDRFVGSFVKDALRDMDEEQRARFLERINEHPEDFPVEDLGSASGARAGDSEKLEETGKTLEENWQALRAQQQTREKRWRFWRWLLSRLGLGSNPRLNLRHAAGVVDEIANHPAYCKPLVRRLAAIAYKQMKDAAAGTKDIGPPAQRAERGSEGTVGASRNPGGGGKSMPPHLKWALREHLVTHREHVLHAGGLPAELQSDDLNLRRQGVLQLIRTGVLKDWWSENAGSFLDGGDAPETQIRSALMRCALRVFQEPLSPRSRKFAVALVPRDFFWPSGSEGLQDFLSGESRQILDCDCRVVTHEGDRLWIYHEDLLHTAHDIRRLPTWREAYHSAPSPELFHIDQRFLKDSRFREEAGAGELSFKVPCGNPDCPGDIRQVPRNARVCPHCARPIRARCGNLGCTVDDLHTRPEATSKTCLACLGFNHGAWWICNRHGKIEVAVSVEKDRCPECIQRHHQDEVGFPLNAISVRPDLALSTPCPKCADIAVGQPSHPVFYVRGDLLPFYRDGVNGHDRAKMRLLVQKYGLREGFRCPNCTTSLIPVHHKDWGKAAPGDTGGEPLGM